MLRPIAPIGFQNRPRPRESVVDQRDLVVQEFWIGLVEVDALLDDRVVIGMDRHAGRVERARALEVAGVGAQEGQTAHTPPHQPLFPVREPGAGGGYPLLPASPRQKNSEWGRQLLLA